MIWLRQKKGVVQGLPGRSTDGFNLFPTLNISICDHVKSTESCGKRPSNCIMLAQQLMVQAWHAAAGFSSSKMRKKKTKKRRRTNSWYTSPFLQKDSFTLSFLVSTNFSFLSHLCGLRADNILAQETSLALFNKNMKKGHYGLIGLRHVSSHIPTGWFDMVIA